MYTFANVQRAYDQQDGETETRPDVSGCDCHQYGERCECNATIETPDYSQARGMLLSDAMRCVYKEISETGLHGDGAPDYIGAFWDSAKLGVHDETWTIGNKQFFEYFIGPWDTANFPALESIESVAIWRDLNTGEQGFRTFPHRRSV